MTDDRRPIGLIPGAPLEARGQDARKYSTTNPVVLRLIDRWLAAVRAAVAEAGDGLLVDVGIGEGLALARLVAAERPVIGVEYREDKVADARNRLSALAPVVADAGMVPVRDGGAGVVTCIEVLEHLVRPEAAVAELARIAGGACVVSVPWEPWFQAGNLGRGKNVRRLGNDPEHVQRFTPRRLRHLLEAHFTTVDVRPVFPWLVAIAR